MVSVCAGSTRFSVTPDHREMVEKIVGIMTDTNHDGEERQNAYLDLCDLRVNPHFAHYFDEGVVSKMQAFKNAG